MENDGVKQWWRERVTNNCRLVNEAGSYKATVRGGSVIDTNNIICPCCGQKMELREYTKKEQDPMYYKHLEQRDFFGSIRYHESEGDTPVDLGMVCTNCGSELKIPATEHCTYRISIHDIQIV